MAGPPGAIIGAGIGAIIGIGGIILWDEIAGDEENCPPEEGGEEKDKDNQNGPKDPPNPGDFADPNKLPPGWEWRGRGEPGSREGAYHNPETGESLHDDTTHPEGKDPHYTYTDPDGVMWDNYPVKGIRGIRRNMVDRMLCKLPTSIEWASHVQSRFESARAIHLLADVASISKETAKIFLPNGVSSDALQSASPTDSLRTIGRAIAPRETWVRRHDVFSEAAAWLLEKYRAGQSAELICEAGFQKVGDEILAERPHTVYYGRPFLQANLSDIGDKMLIKILRWGRSARFLGAIKSDAAKVTGKLEFSDGLFICDALDLDTLIVSDFARAQ